LGLGLEEFSVLLLQE